jgi:predicted TIM-barrel fold metal-dependent hydrolase
MLGNYDSLPDTYTLADYRHEVAGHDVRGIVWSDAGADDPIAAAAWVQRQCDELDVSGALVATLEATGDQAPTGTSSPISPTALATLFGATARRWYRVGT